MLSATPLITGAHRLKKGEVPYLANLSDFEGSLHAFPDLETMVSVQPHDLQYIPEPLRCWKCKHTPNLGMVYVATCITLNCVSVFTWEASGKGHHASNHQ